MLINVFKIKCIYACFVNVYVIFMDAVQSKITGND